LNEESAEKLIEKDIILLLGSTGCGKSTTVHYLCGSQMKKTENDSLLHISATKVINIDL
jgi:ABC-type sugar transport system ATPase subunit